MEPLKTTYRLAEQTGSDGRLIRTIVLIYDHQLGKGMVFESSGGTSVNSRGFPIGRPKLVKNWQIIANKLWNVFPHIRTIGVHWI